MEARLKLWEITDEIQEIGELIAEAGGELSPEMEARLDAMEGALETKVENIALFVKESEANAAAALIEANRLSGIAKRFTTKAEGLKSYLLFALRRSGRSSVKTLRVTVREQKNSRPAIRCALAPEMVPEKFRRVSTTVDLALAYEEWKRGNELPNGFVVEAGTHLRIS